MLRKVWLGSVFVLGIGACTTADTGPNISGVDGTGIVSVRIQPSVDTLLIPDTVRVTDRLALKAIAIGRTGAVTDIGRFVWVSSDPTVATVDSLGVVTPIRTGSVQITASAYRVGTATVVILPAANRITLTPRSDTIFEDEPSSVLSDSARIVAQAYDSANIALPGVRYQWQSGTPSVAAVDSTGLVTALGFGNTTITVRGNGSTTTGTIQVRPRTERIEISPAVDSIFVDDPIVAASDTAHPISRAFDLAGLPLLTGVKFTWQSSSPAVATVDGSGVVRALSLGTTTLTLKAALSEATATVAVVPVVKSMTLSSPVAQVLDGDTLQLTARAFDYANQQMQRRFAWSSSNPTVATVDSTGRVIFVRPGAVVFTASTAFRSANVAVTALPRRLLTVEAGGDFACGVTPLGRSYCWGVGDKGQLGSVADSSCFGGGSAFTRTLPCTLEPKRTSTSISFVSISAGGVSADSIAADSLILSNVRSACAVSSDAMLYCWGDDQFGQVGNGSKGGGPIPQLATVAAVRFASVSVGAYHACALDVSGFAYCWGGDSLGQLGDHRRVNSTTPIPVVGPNGLQSGALRYSKISSGRFHTCAVATSGAAYCWGLGTTGALGDGRAANSDIPVQVVAPEGFVDVAAGVDHSCGVGVSGSVYCWGANARGQVGVAPVGGQQNSAILVGAGYQSIEAGEHFSCGLTTSRTVNCWGRNDFGQLGRGEANPGGSFPNPAPISGGLSFSQISAGVRQICGVAVANSEVYCWGSNIYGALGNQLQAAVRSSPQLVARPR